MLAIYSMLGYSNLGSDDDLPRLVQEIPNEVVTVAQIKQPEARVRLFERRRQMCTLFPIIISLHIQLLGLS